MQGTNTAMQPQENLYSLYQALDKSNLGGEKPSPGEWRKCWAGGVSLQVYSRGGRKGKEHAKNKEQPGGQNAA